MSTRQKKSDKVPTVHYEGEQLKQYEALMKIRDNILNQMKYHAEDALDVSSADHRGSTTHMADISTDNSRHEMELRMLTEESGDLRLIEDALRRLAHGEYGRCQECGEMIPAKRLEIRPYAVYCVKCKEKLEKQGIKVRDY